MGKKWMILICSFSMLTFISSVICIALIYFGEESKTNINSNSILANNNTYKSSNITYYQPNTLALNNLNPGDKIIRTFSITNNNSNTIIYDIRWENISSTWNQNYDSNNIHQEEFVYSVECTNGEKIFQKEMPFNNSDNIIFSNLELKTNKTNLCTLTIEFIKKEQDQSYNFNKNFGGTYKILIKE